jgi:hypothetical protein
MVFEARGSGLGARCFLAAGQEQARAEVPADERQGAETVKCRGRRQIMCEVADADLGEAALREERLVAPLITDGNMSFDRSEDAPPPEALDEVLPVRRMQVQRRARLQGAVNGAKDGQELVVVDVLRHVECESGIEPVRVLCTEPDDVAAVERPVPEATCVPPAFRRAHEGLGEVDADILVDAGTDELEQDAVAASKVGHDLAAGQLEERLQAPHPLDRVGVVLIHVALIVDRAQLLLGAPAARTTGRHVWRMHVNSLQPSLGR